MSGITALCCILSVGLRKKAGNMYECREGSERKELERERKHKGREIEPRKVQLSFGVP